MMEAAGGDGGCSRRWRLQVEMEAAGVDGG